jgi:Domain of unknown function (DUF1905)
MYEFRTEVWRWPGDNAWHFVTVPEALSEEIKDLTEHRRKGFGSVRVIARIGSSTWKTSVFPQKESGCFVLPMKKSIRSENNLEDGTDVTIKLELE